MEKMNKLITSIVLATVITFLTVLIQPIYYVPPEIDLAGSFRAKGFPVAWLTYHSIPGIPVLSDLLEPLSFMFTADFNLFGFLIDVVFWMGIILFVLTLIEGKRKGGERP